MNKNVIKLVLASVILILIGISISFAFYTYNISGTPSGMTITSGKLKIHFNSSRYINTTTASPILLDDILTESETNYFSITNETNSSILSQIFLDQIIISTELANSTKFLYSLYTCVDENDNMCSTQIVSGNFIGKNSTFSLCSQSIPTVTTKYYVLRLWLQEDGTDQTSLMGKTMSGRIKVTG